MKLQSNTSYISITTSSKSDNIPHTNLIQGSFKIEAKVMETSDSMACECKSFTYGFLGFRPTENRDMKLQSKTSYMAVTKSSSSDKIPHTNLIQDSFKIQAKVMETSYSKAYECNLFTHEFIGFRPTEDMDIKLQINK